MTNLGATAQTAVQSDLTAGLQAGPPALSAPSWLVARQLITGKAAHHWQGSSSPEVEVVLRTERRSTMVSFELAETTKMKNRPIRGRTSFFSFI